MDAQRTVGDTAALIALMQCLVRRCAEEPAPCDEPPPEILAENRFLAVRDGPAARLFDGRERGRLAPILERVMEDCRPHARGSVAPESSPGSRSSSCAGAPPISGRRRG